MKKPTTITLEMSKTEYEALKEFLDRSLDKFGIRRALNAKPLLPSWSFPFSEPITDQLRRDAKRPRHRGLSASLSVAHRFNSARSACVSRDIRSRLCRPLLSKNVFAMTTQNQGPPGRWLPRCTLRTDPTGHHTDRPHRQAGQSNP